ncbi:MAG: ArsR family transcriptional regulator, partial [Candidatus Paceibacteria bacterium]
MKPVDEVFASDTRKNILKLLSKRNQRLSDLSRELSKDKSTILEHLRILVE